MVGLLRTMSIRVLVRSAVGTLAVGTDTHGVLPAVLLVVFMEAGFIPQHRERK